MADHIKTDLKNWFDGAKKTVLAGIGNPIRTDDYVGLKIIQDLQGKLPETVLLLETETVPESYLLDIEKFKPTHLLLIDAAFLGLNPGEASILDPEKVADYSAISTHMLPLRIFCEYVKQTTKAKIALLLIEPKSMEFGEGLNAEVRTAAEKYARILTELLG